LSESYLPRTAIALLEKWWSSNHWRKPLVLRGARQVGKTTLIRQFCNKHQIRLIEINLESDFELRESFLQMDPEKILRDIELAKNTSFDSNCLLFIDEIQVVPEALQGLRYFYEKKPNLAVIGAGSLLEFTLSDHSFSMPVGRVEYLFIRPLSFQEYLMAHQQDKLLQAILSFQWGDDFSSLAHEKLKELYFDYLIIGGMPEAVARYRQTKNLEDVRAIHRTILLNYQNDFSKYSQRTPLERLEKIFHFIPTHIGQKIKFSEIDSDLQSKSLRAALELLEKASVVRRVYHSDASGIPLSLGKSERVFKAIFLDIGLVNYFLNFSYKDILSLYQNTSQEIHLLHKGLISEQFVGQELLAMDTFENRELYYWLRDGRQNKAEVDYLLQRGLYILPIEVKFGKTGSIRSLLQFMKEKKHSQSAVKLTLNPPQKEIRKVDDAEFSLLQIPIYMTCRLLDMGTKTQPL
jgi:predicted AAA+ superfamily ATPase